MHDEKIQMYVSDYSIRRVYHHPDDSLWDYKVTVPREYVPIFHALFRQTSELEFRNFLRAHLPYVPYHYDQDNDEIDERTKKVYALIHEFTDDESKKFIEQLPYFR